MVMSVVPPAPAPLVSAVPAFGIRMDRTSSRSARAELTVPAPAESHVTANVTTPIAIHSLLFSAVNLWREGLARTTSEVIAAARVALHFESELAFYPVVRLDIASGSPLPARADVEPTVE